MFINCDIFQKELKYTISFMTGNIEINTINEIINSIIYLEKDENLKIEKNNYNKSSENESEKEEVENEVYLNEVIDKINKEKQEIIHNLEEVTIELKEMNNEMISSEYNGSDDNETKEDNLSNIEKSNDNNTEKLDLNKIINSRKELDIFGYDFNNKNIVKSTLLNNINNDFIEDLNTNDNKMDIE